MVIHGHCWLVVLLVVGFCAGCGTTKLQEATEQLVLSSAVDRSVSMMDFRPLADERVFLDTTYLKNIKSPTFVNADYVISALRQQIMAAGCYLQDEREQADVIIEARLGTLGADDHRVTYGIPENNGLSSAASLLAQTPTPSIPEIAVARRDAREGAAKVAAFAYDRVTRTPIWQSGISQSIATSRNTWVLGVGPFQGGTIRDGNQLARGSNRSGRSRPGASPDQPHERPVVEHTAEVRYDEGWPVLRNSSPPASKSIAKRPVKLPSPGPATAPATAPAEKGTSPENQEMIADEPSNQADSLMR